MKTDEVINRLRALKIDYATRRIGLTPALLPEHLAEFLGYATILYSHYAEYIVQYRTKEAIILAEENDERDAINEQTDKRELKRTIDEKNDRITIRMANLKGNRERLEAEVKSATLHINTIQSLMKRYSDEAKGTM